MGHLKDDQPTKYIFDKHNHKVFISSKFKIMSHLLLTRLREVKKKKTLDLRNQIKSETNFQEQGISRGALIEWFIEYAVSLKLSRTEDAGKEAKLLLKVIHKLIKQGKILTFVPFITKKKQESTEEHALRIQDLTVLISGDYLEKN